MQRHGYEITQLNWEVQAVQDWSINKNDEGTRDKGQQGPQLLHLQNRDIIYSAYLSQRLNFIYIAQCLTLLTGTQVMSSPFISITSQLLPLSPQVTLSYHAV